MANKCIYCGAFDLKEEEDRSKPPISFVPRPIYHKKYTCKKCRKSFTKEQMENPPAQSDGTDAQPEAGAPGEPAAAAATGGFAKEPAATPAHGHSVKPASSGFSSESYSSPGFSSSPASSRPTGFATLESDSSAGQTQEKKSYMQIMKEKQQYQSQQFQATVAAEQAAAKPEAKPAPKPGPKPAAKPAPKPVAKPAGGPIMKPMGLKPPAPEPSAPAEAPLPDLPELDALPDLPPVEALALEIPQSGPDVAEAPVAPEATKPVAPAPSGFQSVEAPAPPVAPAIKPPVKPAGAMKPPVKPAGAMKPPVKPVGAMKPPVPIAPAPSGFQSIEAPAPKYVPPVPDNEPSVAAAPSVPATISSPSNRLQQLLDALDKVLGNLAWPQEKKDMLKQELVNLPEGEQISFLEQLGVEIPPEQAAPPAPAPVAPIPAAPIIPARSVPAPMVPAPSAFTPVPVAPSMGHPPVKPAGGMKPPVSPPVQPVVAMRPPVSPPISAPVPGHPPMKPASGMKPPVSPPVSAPVPGHPPMKPAGGMKPPVQPPVAKPSAAAVGLFDTIDQAIEQTVAGDFDLDNFLESGLDLAAPGVPTINVAAPVTRPPAPAPPAVGEEENGAAKPAIKVSQISTKVEKKSDADLKREEERQKAQAASESSLVYMRLLAFEKACSIPKTFKLADFCRMLKDVDQQTIANFIVAVDNDFIIKYDNEKAQVVVSEISGPEMEILSRQFEKWLRFGRL